MARRFKKANPYQVSSYGKSLSFSLSKKGNLVARKIILVNGKATVDQDHAMIYQLLPPRAWFVDSTKEKVVGKTFDLDIRALAKAAEFWRSANVKKILAGEFKKSDGSPFSAPKVVREGGTHPLRAFWHQLPEKVRKQLRDLIHTSEHKGILRCYAYDQEYRKLLVQFPVLARYIAKDLNTAKWNSKTYKTVEPTSVKIKRGLRKALSTNRLELFKTLCLPENLWSADKVEARNSFSKRHLKVVQKLDINFECGNIDRWFIWACETRTVASAPVVNQYMIDALMKAAGRNTLEFMFQLRDGTDRGPKPIPTEDSLPIGPACFHEMAKLSRFRTKAGNKRKALEEWSMHLSDIRRFSDTLKEHNPNFKCSQANSLNALKNLHDKLSFEAKKITEPHKFEPFKRPVPFEGTKEIIPLTKPIELEVEGQEMHHCVGGYSSSVEKGQSYIYAVRMLNDEGKLERATLELSTGLSYWDRRHNSNERVFSPWHLAQLRGPCNQTPSTALTQRVHDWLNNNWIPETSAGANWWDDDNIPI